MLRWCCPGAASPTTSLEAGCSGASRRSGPRPVTPATDQRSGWWQAMRTTSHRREGDRDLDICRRGGPLGDAHCPHPLRRDAEPDPTADHPVAWPAPGRIARAARHRHGEPDPVSNHRSTSAARGATTATVSWWVAGCGATIRYAAVVGSRLNRSRRGMPLGCTPVLVRNPTTGPGATSTPAGGSCAMTTALRPWGPVRGRHHAGRRCASPARPGPGVYQFQGHPPIIATR
jgi:hypothetical protein